MTRHYTFLSHLNRVAKNKKKRNCVLRKANKDQVNSLRNLCYNVCKKKIKLQEGIQKKLYPFRGDIRALANRKTLKSTKGAKNRLLQRGGFLPIILPAVLSLLSTVGARAISKAVGV